jgi:hypothetical protein
MNLEAEIEAATNRLHAARRAMWKLKLGSPEIAKTAPPPKVRKRPEPFEGYAPQRNYPKYSGKEWQS